MMLHGIGTDDLLIQQLFCYLGNIDWKCYDELWDLCKKHNYSPYKDVSLNVTV